MRLIAVWADQETVPHVFQNCFAVKLDHRILIFDFEGQKAAEFSLKDISWWIQSAPGSSTERLLAKLV